MGLGIVYLQKAQFLTEKIPMNHDKFTAFEFLGSDIFAFSQPNVLVRFSL